MLDSGATHCFLCRRLAASLGDAWVPALLGGPATVRQANGSARPTFGSAAALLQLGDLLEEMLFTVFDVDCNVDIILGYDWLRSHDLAFLYETQQVCFCAERGSFIERPFTALPSSGGVESCAGSFNKANAHPRL